MKKLTSALDLVMQATESSEQNKLIKRLFRHLSFHRGLSKKSFFIAYINKSFFQSFLLGLEKSHAKGLDLFLASLYNRYV